MDIWLKNVLSLILKWYFDTPKFPHYQILTFDFKYVLGNNSQIKKKTHRLLGNNQLAEV